MCFKYTIYKFALFYLRYNETWPHLINMIFLCIYLLLRHRPQNIVSLNLFPNYMLTKIYKPTQNTLIYYIKEVQLTLFEIYVLCLLQSTDFCFRTHGIFRQCDRNSASASRFKVFDSWQDTIKGHKPLNFCK